MLVNVFRSTLFTNTPIHAVDTVERGDARETRAQILKHPLYSNNVIFYFRKEDLYFFLKDAFSVEDDKHYELLTRIGKEKKPQNCIEVFVDRADNLIAKDPNGSYLLSTISQFVFYTSFNIHITMLYARLVLDA